MIDQLFIACVLLCY